MNGIALLLLPKFVLRKKWLHLTGQICALKIANKTQMKSFNTLQQNVQNMP